MWRYLIFGVVSLSILVQSMSTNSVAVAFPEMTLSFSISLVLAGWVLTIQRLATLVTTPLAGKASDSIGRKRTFMFFVVTFTLGSALCAVAPNVFWLLGFRAIQGIGIGGFIVSATGITADIFPESRLRMVGLLTSFFYVGNILGPNIGGWLTQAYGWKSVFWFNVPFGVIALVGGALILPPDGKIKAANIDLKGGGLLAMSLGTLVAGLTMLNNLTPISLALAAGLLLLGSGALLVFFRHERKDKDPIIELELLQGRPFFASNMFNLTLGLLVGVMVFLPLYTVRIYGVSTLVSGMVMTPMTIGMMVMSTTSSFLLARWGYRKPMLIGIGLMILSAWLLGIESKGIGVLGTTLTGLSVMLFIVTILGLGQGAMIPAANNACIELMPSRISTITGLRQTMRNLGYILGVVMTSIALDNFKDPGSGFRFVFFGAALLSIIAIPCIFAMPRSSCDPKLPLRAQVGNPAAPRSST